MKKTIFTIIALLALSFSANAAPRSKSQMMDAARQALAAKLVGGQHKSQFKGELAILHEEGPLSVVGYTEGGYAIVTNDDLLPEVIGYSSFAYSADCDNDNFLWWWRTAKASAEYYVSQGERFVRKAPDARYQHEVPQLMSTVWGQLEPFNNMCPIQYDRSGNSLGHTLVGCVATAATQIMKYHEYPAQGTGTHVDTQTTDAFGNVRPIKVDLSDYTYDYSQMKDIYTVGNYEAQEADEVAKLSYTAGVVFGMIYGVDASGTYLDSCAVGLKEHFGYKDAKYYSRYYTDTNTWMDRIYNELSNSRPVCYGGADDMFTVGGGGHCFVFDGYDASGLVHVNWGWYGKYDGYYDVAILNPGIHGFRNQQDMVIGIKPPTETANEQLVLSQQLSISDFEEIVAQSQNDGVRDLDISACALEDGILPDRAFAGSMLRRIVLPGNTRVIGDGAFADCKQLTEVVFPENDGSQEFVVEDNVIYNTDATEVIEVLPYYHNNVRVMDGYTSLLTLREGVKRIHNNAFDGCFRIKGVVIPANVTHIGKGVFDNARSIKRITVKSRIPADVALGTFDGLDVGFTVLAIPAGTRDVYQRYGEWGSFFRLDNIVELGTCIKARNAYREAGEQNPVFGYQMFGEYVMGEPVIRCEADENSPAGEYPIIVELGTLEGEDIYLEDGVLTIFGSDGISKITPLGEQEGAYNLHGIKTTNSRIIIKNGKKYIK